MSPLVLDGYPAVMRQTIRSEIFALLPTRHRPDRASLTVALNTARDQLIQAAGVLATTTVDLVGKIGRAVLDQLLADRRLRASPRVVKRAISKYNARGPNINRTSFKATISIDILTPPTPLTTSAGP
jgi:hypothetical protein